MNKISDDFVEQRNNKGALLNVNMEALKSYKELRDKNQSTNLEKEQEKEQINNLNQQINMLSKDVDNIKEDLKTIVELLRK